MYDLKDLETSSYRQDELDYIALLRTLNPGKDGILVSVTNTGDRPIQVGSHYHFVETNPYLNFDRKISYGR